MPYANINRVYTAVQDILNKQQLGFVTPSQCNTLARTAQDNIFDRKITNLNLQVKNKLRGIETANGDLKARVQDDIAVLFVYDETAAPVSGTNIFRIPENCAYLNTITYKGENVDRVDASKARYIVNSYYTPPTQKYAIAVLGSGDITVYPTTLDESIKLSYYKRPRGSRNNQPSVNFPTWGYTVVGETQAYNPATSYDFELPQHLEHEIIMEMVSLLGVNLRDAEVVQYAESKINKEMIETPQ
jgi:hypothetical protein